MALEKIQELTPQQQVVQLVAEDCADVAIAKLADKYRGLKAVDNASYEVLKRALRDIVSRRTGVDKRRKSLKNDVEKEAKRITALLTEIENPLKAEKDKYEEEAKRITAEKAAIEAARIAKIQARIATFAKPLENASTKTAAQLLEDLHFLGDCIETDTFGYQEFSELAYQTQQDTYNKLSAVHLQKKMAEDELARIEEEKAAIALERAALEKEKAELAAKQATEAVKEIEISDLSALDSKLAAGRIASVEINSSVEAIKQNDADHTNVSEARTIDRSPDLMGRLINTHVAYGAGNGITIHPNGISAIDDRTLYSEAAIVTENMQHYGGGFVKALGIALSKASMGNMLRIRKAFPEYWNQYLNWGK